LRVIEKSTGSTPTTTPATTAATAAHKQLIQGGDSLRDAPAAGCGEIGAGEGDDGVVAVGALNFFHIGVGGAVDRAQV
jgi:hypothetical protein